MKTDKPLILISNDDGYNAKGILELIGCLADLGEVVVMAPDGPRSGASCAITSEYPVKYQEVKRESNLTIYKCNGTPVDCVKLALYELLPRVPDLVIGGINHGDNSSVNVHYSGTMGVVIEGCLKGIPSIGFSLCNHAPDADFEPMLPYVKQIVVETLTNGLPKGVCLNVNAPLTDDIKGVKICRQTQGDWSNEWKRSQHPRGSEYFWLTGKYTNLEPESVDTDQWALANQYIAVTPVQIDMTAYNLIDKLNNWNLKP